MDTPPIKYVCLPFLKKGDKNFCDFPFVSLNEEDFSKWALLLKERICSLGGKFSNTKREAKMKVAVLLPLQVHLKSHPKLSLLVYAVFLGHAFAGF